MRVLSERPWRTATATVLALLLAAPVLAVAQTRDATETRNHALVHDAFAAWARGEGQVFDLLAPDVTWMIKGSGPSAQTYRSRQAFLDDAVAPFAAELASPLVPTVRRIWSDGDEVLVYWDGATTLRDGTPYRNSYLWIFTLRGAQVVEVTAFLDLPAYDAVLQRAQTRR
ncbi:MULTISPECIES: nuclear transport factor 2 family protein [Luteimonas]|uniref:nuclear transport factor 2 family protein n=1 Tax=Luteimonas TaxID=83614 RepID=UPI000C7D3A13|nr:MULTISPECIES: nuclear transport factor 2 family protein [Luteimonas]